MNHGASQSQRRVKYSLNVAVAVITATILVVLVNAIAERKLRQGGPWKRWIRYDLTATRSYSLSDQTIKVLGQIKDEHRIVTLLEGDELLAVQQARDLIDEYGHYCDKITVEHINPGRELSRLLTFSESLQDRFRAGLEPLEQALREGQAVLEESIASFSSLQQLLASILQDPLFADVSLREPVQMAHNVFVLLAKRFEQLDSQIEQAKTDSMPDYWGLINVLRQSLRQGHEQYEQAIASFGQLSNDSSTTGSIQELLLRAVDLLKRSGPVMTQALSSLDQLQPVEEYDRVLAQLRRPQTILIVGPRRVQALGLGELFRNPDEIASGQGAPPELLFQGEEKLTGSLLSMTLEHRPLVVFVSDGPTPVFGPRGNFNHVVRRLKNLDFEVQQWSPVGQPGPMGQTMPPGPPPQPRPGQKAVWVALAGMPPSAMNPMAGAGYEQVVDLIRQRLDEGDGALVMLAISRSSPLGGGTSNSVADLLTPWAISPLLDRLVLREEMGPNRRTQPSGNLPVNHWPKQSPITATLGGLQGLFVLASPLVLGDGDAHQVKLSPLVEISGDDIWAERNFDSGSPPSRDPDEAGSKYVIAAAAERGTNRLVVVADPQWAIDQIAAAGIRDPSGALMATFFPANTELFVNSVTWLAGLDQLIAASARTQDIRRVDPDLNLASVQWGLSLGMPLAAAIAGLSVWLSRRRA